MFLETNPNAKVVTSGNMLFLKGICQELIAFPVLVFVSFVMSSLLFGRTRTAFKSWPLS